jgi:hypothetical protein
MASTDPEATYRIDLTGPQLRIEAVPGMAARSATVTAGSGFSWIRGQPRAASNSKTVHDRAGNLACSFSSAIT